MSGAPKIDRGGFEAASWRRRLWAAQYSIERRYLPDDHPSGIAVDDVEMDRLLEGGESVRHDMEALRRGRRPRGAWLKCPVVTKSMRLAGCDSAAPRWEENGG